MHSIVTTFREAVIKVEVANFGAAVDTLIDQDGKGLVGVWCCSCTVFPPLLFFFYGRPTGGFEEGGRFAYSAEPCAAVFGKCSPLKMADVARTEGLF